MGGTETVPTETWIGINADGQWVRADGVDVPAVMFLKSVGRPGELADAVRSCIVMDPTANLVPGTKQFCGSQMVGYTLDHQSILMEAHDAPVSREPVPGDVPPVQEPEADRVKGRGRRGGGVGEVPLHQ